MKEAVFKTMSRDRRVELGQLPVSLGWRWRNYHHILWRQCTKLYGGNVPNCAAAFGLGGAWWHPDKITRKKSKAQNHQTVLITTRATCPAHLILLDVITRTILG